LRVVPINSVRDALTVVLKGLRSGVGITRTKDPDALDSAVERVMHIVADNGRYDRTPRDSQRDDKLQAVLTLLDVASRTVVWLFLEKFRFQFVPVFHGLQGRLAAQG